MANVMTLQERARSGLAPSGWYRTDSRLLSLQFRPDTPYEIWAEETLGLLALASGIQWLVGDALAFGEAHFGELTAQIYDSERYTYEAIERMARVARAIPPSRRRPAVSFAVHQDVSALPLAEQEALLDWAAETHATSAEARALVKQTKQRLAREAAARLPTPTLDLDGIALEVADARMLPLEDEVADLIVTSPPYALGVPYGIGDVAAEEWSRFMAAWLGEAWRIAKPSGRLALNVPLDTSEPEPRPTYAEALSIALALGWTYQGTIAWHDGGTTKGALALGSVDSASRPHHVSAVEHIALLSKGPWGPSSHGRDDIGHAAWQQAGRGPWVFPGESSPWEGHPAAYPLELPRRLIPYLCRVGDLVVDPFVGSGTTAVAAYRAARRFWGGDLDPLCIASATRRLKREG